jgi:hypothetical protein
VQLYDLDGRQSDLPNESLSLKVDLTRSLDLIPYQLALSVALVFMVVVPVNNYLDN